MLFGYGCCFAWTRLSDNNRDELGGRELYSWPALFSLSLSRVGRLEFSTWRAIDLKSQQISVLAAAERIAAAAIPLYKGQQSALFLQHIGWYLLLLYAALYFGNIFAIQTRCLLNSLTRHLRSGFDRFQVEFRPVMWPVSVSILCPNRSLCFRLRAVLYIWNR